MELKVPPVLVFGFFALAMYVLATFLPVGFFDFTGRMVLSVVLASLGTLAGLIALFQFFKGGTTIDPRNPKKTKALVTSGIFQMTRNPMYLGLLLLLLAFGTYLGNAFNTLTAAGFVSYMNKFQIIPEERLLLAAFGKRYREYTTLVRRWF